MESSCGVLYIFFLSTFCTSAYAAKENRDCQEPEREINNAVLIKRNLKITYQEGDILHYKCKPDFDVQTEPLATCSEGQWHYPQCIQANENRDCQEPEREINNAVMIKRNLKITYQEGDILHYKCKPDFDFQTEPLATCSDGQWHYPQCIQAREIYGCPAPEKEINAAILKETYQEGDTVQYSCRAGFNFQTGPQATCTQGQWKYPQCIQTSPKRECPEPERAINNGVLIKRNLKATYQEGDTLEYKCEPGVDLQTATCFEGQWNYPHCIQHE